MNLTVLMKKIRFTLNPRKRSGQKRPLSTLHLQIFWHILLVLFAYTNIHDEGKLAGCIFFPNSSQEIHYLSLKINFYLFNMWFAYNIFFFKKDDHNSSTNFPKLKNFLQLIFFLKAGIYFDHLAYGLND